VSVTSVPETFTAGGSALRMCYLVLFSATNKAPSSLRCATKENVSKAVSVHGIRESEGVDI
jgi:hypothetical protein